MMRWIVGFAVAAIVLLNVSQALSQATVRPCVTTGSTTCPPVSASNPMPISGTITATPTGTQNVTGTWAAGTAADGVLTVQGIASMTPLLATLSGTNNIATVSTLTTLTQFGGQAINLGNGTVGTGTLRVTIASDSTGVVGTSVAAAATGGASFLNIAAGQATTTVKSGAGTLYSICLNSAASATNTTTVYDNTAASGTVIARPAAVTATVPTCLSYGPTGLAFATGLTFITAAANGSDMTVAYK